jgi:shikimate 5-dehydrogenase
MLAAQGEAAFQLWFAVTPTAQVMRRALDQDE